MRAALLLLFRQVLDAVPGTRVAPFFPLVAAHLCAATTKLDPALRLDALSFVDVWLQCCPEVATADRCGDRLLAALLRLLPSANLPSRGTGGLAAHVGTLQRLLTLLDLMVRASGTGGAQAASRSDTSEGGWLLRAGGAPAPPERGVGPGAPGEAAVPTPAQLLEQLAPTLLECWHELAVGGLGMSGRPSQQYLAQLRVVLELLRLLVRGGGTMPDFEQHFMVHFPIGATQQWDQATAQGLGAANLVLAELATCSTSGATASLSRVADYITAALGRSRTTIGCLPVLRLLVRRLDNGSAAVLEGVARCCAAANAASAELPRLVAFLAGLFGVGPDAEDYVLPALPAAAQAVLVRWAATLPRLLWELKRSSPATTELALGVLLRAGQRRVMVSVDTPLLDSLQRSLAPLFHARARGRDVLGMVASLPAPAQLGACSLLRYIDHPTPALLNAVAHCCHADALPAAAVGRVLEAAASALRCSAVTAADLQAFASLIASIAVGHSVQQLAALRAQGGAALALDPRRWARRDAILEQVRASAAAAVPGAGALFAGCWPALASALAPPAAPADALLGAVALAVAAAEAGGLPSDAAGGLALCTLGAGRQAWTAGTSAAEAVERWTVRLCAADSNTLAALLDAAATAAATDSSGNDALPSFSRAVLCRPELRSSLQMDRARLAALEAAVRSNTGYGATAVERLAVEVKLI